MSSQLEIPECEIALVTRAFTGGGHERDTVLLFNALAAKGVRCRHFGAPRGGFTAVLGRSCSPVGRRPGRSDALRDSWPATSDPFTRSSCCSIISVARSNAVILSAMAKEGNNATVRPAASAI